MRTIIGVMGPGAGATRADLDHARELGALIAREGWVLLTGGRDAGVMAAAVRGAKEAGGLTLGILPGESAAGAAEGIDLVVVTGMGSARNNINVLSSAVVVGLRHGRGHRIRGGAGPEGGCRWRSSAARKPAGRSSAALPARGWCVPRTRPKPWRRSAWLGRRRATR